MLTISFFSSRSLLNNVSLSLLGERDLSLPGGESTHQLEEDVDQLEQEEDVDQLEQEEDVDLLEE